MNFKFIVDKNYLLLKLISNRNNFKDLEEWKNNVIVRILGQKIMEEIEAKKETIEEYFISGGFSQFVQKMIYILRWIE